MKPLTMQDMRRLNGGDNCSDLATAIVVLGLLEPVGAAILVGYWLSQGCHA